MRKLSPTDIKVKLLRKGIKQAEIAERADCSQSSVSQVINQKMKSRAIARVLAQVLGVSIEEVEK